jgi:filamentous hemagglutinin family protein
MNQTHNWLQKFLVCGFLIFTTTPAIAQITPDNTLGAESSRLTPNVLINGASSDRIDGGATRGSNLFHSFSQFNINDGQRVYFGNPVGVENILTRVTGGNASNIFGTLGVNGAANLFLINPSGILFGRNARLDVRGSFLGTTANAIQFGNQGNFSVTNPQAPPLLTISAPISLQFSSQPGGIISQSNQLGVGGSTLALIGGAIALDDSFLFANNGQVQLGAVGGETTVDLNVNGSKLNFNLPENASRAPITLTNGAFVAASGNNAIKLVGGQINLNDSSVSGQNGGSISINATGLGLDNGSIIGTGTQRATKAGDIQIQASDAVTLANGSRIFSNSPNSATGNGGDIAINARKIAVTGDGIAENSGSISTLTLGQGNAGNLTLNATDSVNINGGSVSVATGGAGNAGNLTVRAGNAVNVTDIGTLSLLSVGSGSTGNLRIETGTLRVQNANLSGGVTAVAAGSGSVGSISIQARDAVEVINSAINAQVLSGSAGRAGDITIETPQVNLKDGGQVRTDTFSSANAGNIIIRASEFVDISGISPSTLDVVLSSQVSSGTTLDTTGNGGNITIPTGNGGNITIETPRLSLNQGGSVSTSSFQSRGNAGNITIRAKDVQLDGFVTVPNGGLSFLSELNSEVQGSDANVRGGTITIDTERLRLSNGADVSTSVLLGRGQGGNLVVRATDSIYITGVGARRNDGSFAPSGLFAELQTGGIGSGGNISVETGRLNMSNGGQISASTFNQGNAGDIAIRAAQIDLRGENTIITTAVQREARGNGGNININSDRLVVNDGAEVSSGTLGRGNAGNLTIQANQIELFNTGGLLTTTGSGNAGDLTVNTQRLSLRNGGLVQASTASGSTGRGGNLTINASDSVEVIGFSNDNRFRSNLSVRSLGEGQAGNLIVNSPHISVADQGTINAQSSVSDGGDITLNTNLLLLRRGGNISATAGLAQGAGNGGNIKINAPFIIAVPKENSDISANAFQGRGGNVTIKTDGLFGIAPASFPTAQSDITASSELGVQGQINIIQPDVQPTEGLVELPGQVFDASNQIAQDCPRGRNAKKRLGEFIVTGRGIPPNATQPLNGRPNLTQLATLDSQSASTKPNTSSTPNLPPTPQNTIVEAQGWVKTPDGKIMLVAQAPEVTPNATSSSAACPVSR